MSGKKGMLGSPDNPLPIGGAVAPDWATNRATAEAIAALTPLTEALLGRFGARAVSQALGSLLVESLVAGVGAGQAARILRDLADAMPLYAELRELRRAGGSA